MDGGDPGINGAALLDVLAVQRYVEPFPFLVFVDPQSNGHIDDFEDDVADDEAVNNGRQHGLQLREDIPGQAAIERGTRENTGKQCANDAANTVHAEGIEGIVVPERLLQ